MSNFLKLENINRYSDLYLNQVEEINEFDPVLYLNLFGDYCNKNKEFLYICNRQLICKCEEDCMCDDDNDVLVSVKSEVVSNCKFNLDITLQSKYKLNKKMLWNIFILDDNDSEKSVFEIDPIRNTITFKLPMYEKDYTFTSEDQIKQSKYGFVSVQFNYMEFF